VTGDGKRGVNIAPDLEQVAPFIASGGGALVDDVANPTTLRFASGSSASAMEKLLEVVRDPQLTFDEDEIAAVPAEERFRQGQLGMMLGFRDLTPLFRAQAGLDFDVMPLPRIGSNATVGDSSGLCLSAATLHPEETADFLAYAVSAEAAGLLAATGYVVPTNLVAVHSGSFLQAGSPPANAGVFAASVRDIQPMPTVAAWPEVATMAEPLLTQLFYQPVIDPLQLRLEVLDNASVPLLLPGSSPSPE
jgi:multiple sugar transport system substrate-binding protein